MQEKQEDELDIQKRERHKIKYIRNLIEGDIKELLEIKKKPVEEYYE